MKDREIAVRLALAIKKLRTRLREAATSQNLPISHLSILKHLRDAGASTAAALAISEHVSQQAIAQSLAALRDAGFVQAKPDKEDGRKNLISLTAAGEKLYASAIASRDAWLVAAIKSEIAPEERADLLCAVELLERLAGAETSVRS